MNALRLPPHLLHFALTLCALLTQTQCSSVPFLSAPEPEVVYALGSTQGYPSPTDPKLKPVIPSLNFPGDSYNVSGRHRVALQNFAQRAVESKQQYLIVGYASPDLPKDQARSLSERRAQGVRQQLILLGVEPANLLTCGVGSDFAPTGPTTGVVVIYADAPSPAEAATAVTDATAAPAP